MELPEELASNKRGLYALAISLGHVKRVRINSLNMIKEMHDTALFMRTNEDFRDF